MACIAVPSATACALSPACVETDGQSGATSRGRVEASIQFDVRAHTSNMYQTSPGSRDPLVERSKAVAQGAIPKGSGFEPHRCHFPGIHDARRPQTDLPESARTPLSLHSAWYKAARVDVMIRGRSAVCGCALIKTCSAHGTCKSHFQQRSYTANGFGPTSTDDSPWSASECEAKGRRNSMRGNMFQLKVFGYRADSCASPLRCAHDTTRAQTTQPAEPSNSHTHSLTRSSQCCHNAPQ